MKRTILSLVGCLCLIATASAQSDPASVFAEHLKRDDSFLKTNLTIAKAYETWTVKLTEATATYQKELESLLDKEKSKGDLEYVKSLERAVEKAKTQHSSACILFDRLPPRAATLLTNLNKVKNRENKIFVAILDKEITATLKQKGADEAKKIETFLYSLFLSESFEPLYSKAVRLENKIYLYFEGPKNWQGAYDWCRERNGDLASVGSPAVHAFLCKYLIKIGKTRPTLVGGATVGGKWFWTDGTPWGFTSWAPGQPSGKSQDRLTIMFRINGDWDDVAGDTQRPFIIQWTLY